MGRSFAPNNKTGDVKLSISLEKRRELNKLAAREYRKKNREKYLLCARNFYYRHREKCLINAGKYRKALKENLTPEEKIFRRIKYKCNREKIEFTLSLEDIKIPEFCPILGYKLKISDEISNFDSPSVDRINPKGGYTKDNIRIISLRANTIKSDASAEELFKVYLYTKELQSAK